MAAPIEELEKNRPMQGADVSEIGEILRNARLKKHLTITEISIATRIKPQFLEALEEGNYNQLPGAAYVTGFLRNYSRYLGLQPDDLVQEYFASRPAPTPAVRAATRVLANGYERQNRKRIFWALSIVVMLFAGGYAIKQYSDTSAQVSAPLNVTPANLGQTQFATHPVHHPRAPIFHLKLRAISPVWVHVTVDGTSKFIGMLRARAGAREFAGHHAIFVVAYDGTRVRATLNGRIIGAVALRPGLTVHEATAGGWQRVS